MAKKDNSTPAGAKNTASNIVREAAEIERQVQGRGAFIVELTAVGVAVASTILTDDGQALAMPAVFPNVEYALSQIDEMRSLVIRYFEQAESLPK